MINLRYHIVSITAVFLALGIGITMGSTFLGKATVDQIDKNVTSARAQVRDVKARNAELTKTVAQYRGREAALTDQGVDRIFDGSLKDVPVLVVAAAGVDQDSLDKLTTALASSGALFDGTLTLTDKLQLDTSGDAATMAQLLGVTVTPARMQQRLASRLATLMLDAAAPADTPPGTTTSTTVPGTTTVAGTPSSSTTAGSTSTTAPTPATPPALLTSLIDKGFLDYEAASGGAPVDQVLTQQGYRYVVVTGATPDVPDASFLRPLLRDMAADQPAPVVAASAAVGDDPEAVRSLPIKPLIDDDSIGARVSTVDDLESFSGVAAVVMSLEDLGQGRRGHYGVGEGAKSLLPSAPR